MMNLSRIQHYTVTIIATDKSTILGCFDLPKDMPVPRKGDNLFIKGDTLIVLYIDYHVNPTSFSIIVFARNS